MNVGAGAPPVLRALGLAALLAVTAPAIACAGETLAARPLSRMDLPWWRERFEAKRAELAANPPALVFYGDSITQDFEHDGPEPWQRFAPVWQHFYAGRHAVNLGFKGDSTAHLLWRIEHGEAEGIAPKLAVVLIGANNFGRVHWDAEATLTGIEAVVAALRERLPRTRLLLLGVLPSIRSPWVDEQTRALNGMLRIRFGGGGAVDFVDASALFVKDGRVDPSAFLDLHLTPPDPPLHPSPETQARLAALIEPYVARALGDAERR